VPRKHETVLVPAPSAVRETLIDFANELHQRGAAALDEQQVQAAVLSGFQSALRSLHVGLIVLMSLIFLSTPTFNCFSRRSPRDVGCLLEIRPSRRMIPSQSELGADALLCSKNRRPRLLYAM